MQKVPGRYNSVNRIRLKRDKRLSTFWCVDAYFGPLEELQEIFGKRIDLVMAGTVKNRDIEWTKQMLYAA